MYISKRSGMDHTVLPGNTPCLPKGGDQSKGKRSATVSCSVHNEALRAENRALGNTTTESMKGRKVVITFNTEGAT